jgi:hypothetical protein
MMSFNLSSVLVDLLVYLSAMSFELFDNSKEQIIEKIKNVIIISVFNFPRYITQFEKPITGCPKRKTNRTTFYWYHAHFTAVPTMP